jgi:ABC-type enterochelin transport system ATPase subunit
MGKVTYWVEYRYKYKFFDVSENEWTIEEMVDAGRFHCPKKDIRKEVRKCVEKELEYEKYEDLVIEILDYYITTDEEV